MDYADQLIAESRNDVNYKADYTHKCRCWGKCFDEYKEQTQGMDTKKFQRLFGAKELHDSSTEYMGNGRSKITKVYYGPWREFLVNETGIWTTIKCPICGYTDFWSIGDGDALF
jgi:hypothetical protein